MSKSAAQYLLWAAIVAVGAFTVYCWVTYSGPYRWLAEWQLAQFGSYSDKVTVVGTMLVGIIPLIVIARIFGLETRFRPAQQSISGVPSRGGVAGMAIAGVALLAAGAGAGWLGYQKSMVPVTVEDVDLAAHKAPQSTHVRMTGLALPGFLLQFETKSAGSTRTDTYLPIAAPDWKRGDPLVYFLKTNINAYIPPEGGRTITIAPETPPFKMTESGVLMRGDLPGPIEQEYRKHNIALGTPTIVLDANPGADLEIYWIIAAGGGVIGFIFLLVAGMTSVRRRRVSQA